MQPVPAPLLTKRERMELRDEKAIKQESMRLVKAEKLADAESERRLSEAYRVGKKTFDENPKTGGWTCPSCNHRGNLETRWICESCCATAPFALSGSQETQQRQQGRPATRSGHQVSASPPVSIKAAPTAPKDGGSSFNLSVAGRSYRVLHTEVLKERCAVHNRRQKKHPSDAEGHHAAVSTAAYAPYDGDSMPRATPLPVVVRGVVADVLCDDEDDDEPGCFAQPRKNNTSARHGADDCADDCDDDDDNVAGTVAPRVSFNTTTNQFYAQLPVPTAISQSTLLRKQLLSTASTIRAATRGVVVDVNRDSSNSGSARGQPSNVNEVVIIRCAHRDVVEAAAVSVSDCLRGLTADINATSAMSRHRPDEQQPAAAPAVASSPSEPNPHGGGGGYTHFLSIPLGTIPSLAPFVEALMSQIRSIAGLPHESGKGSAGEQSPVVEPSLDAADDTVTDDHFGIDPSILQEPAKLHLTLLMLSLPTREKVEAAKALLPLVKHAMDVSFPPQTVLHVKSIQPMTPNIAKCNVLYLDIAEDAGGRAALIRLMQSVHKIYLDAAVVSERETQLGEKIHATIINTKWRRSADGKKQRGGRGGRWQRNTPFDATRVLEVLGSASLAAHRPLTLELSKLSGAPQSSGYYAAEAVEHFL